MSSLIGQRLGQYEITGPLGRGGMAVVYRARQLSVHREVAIKVIKAELTDEGESDLPMRFEREAELIASLSHPYILKLFDYGQQDGLIYLESLRLARPYAARADNRRAYQYHAGCCRYPR